MDYDQFSSTALNFKGIQVGYGSIQEDVFQGKDSFSGMELLGEIDPLHAPNGKGAKLFKDQNQNQLRELKIDNLMLEEVNFYPDMPLQPTQLFQETTGLMKHGVACSEPVEYNKQVHPSLASLELLRNYGSRFKRLREQNISTLSNIETSFDHHKMSTEEIIRVAGARHSGHRKHILSKNIYVSTSKFCLYIFISLIILGFAMILNRYVQYSAHWNDSFCIPMHPYGLDLVGLSEEENRDVELAQFLLAAAEKVGCQQFERANRLLFHCQWNSSDSASPAQRVIFHFARALRERIDRETGRVTVKGSEKNEERELIQKMDTNVALTCHLKIPFNQVMQLTGIQAIVEHVASETKIHLIDLEIRSGVQCTALMQALIERQDCIVQLLKITAIGLNTYKTMMEETGKRLASFAESLNLPFSYKAVFVADIAEIREDRFEIGEDEAVAVYSPYFLRCMISRPDCMENLMRVIRNMKPVIMIVLEVEANHNSPSFVNRFIESLFFYSAFFDCLGTCIKHEIECRMTIEAVLSEGIRDIVAMEGRERTVRNVKIDVWRRFFARYRMVETEFSESSLYQAELVAKKFAFGKFCTIDKNAKCVTVGWKGTPLHSISAW
ncbi:DELLA protein GAI1, partial [Mucuna pruriens]